MPNLMGGAADLAPSTKTYMEGAGDFSAENYAGSNMHFGVREIAMAAIGNGMMLHGGLRSLYLHSLYSVIMLSQWQDFRHL